MESFDVLGTPLAATTYGELIAHCQKLARDGGTWAIDFANTQVVTMRRHEAAFRELTKQFDLFAPDGMPLIWTMNRCGANLSDRVYGPTFMRKFLEATSSEAKHYLLGGSEESGRKLRARFPKANVVGSYHGRCALDGTLEGEDSPRVLQDLARLAPDFIWVGLGTPKQDAWIHRHKKSIQRGVLLAVGFAFDVNAGTKSDAPAWMQKRGLTWVFRLLSEPRRLLGRYLRYNTLFLFYLGKDALLPRRL